VSKSVQQVIAKIGKGMALTTQYEVKFKFPGETSGLKNVLQGAVADRTAGAFTGDGLIVLLCNEAQLPNVSSLTGQTNGVYLGENQVNYAYGRLYTDISLGWMCDVNMTPLKFLQEWHNYIYSSGLTQGGGSGERSGGNLVFESGQSNIETVNSVTRNLPTRVKFPSQYQANIQITKLDMGRGDDRKSMCYTLLNAFPHSIDATPLSYGSSQLVNVSASFYYSKYYVNYAYI
jgi:hypothetical protein